MDLRGVGPGQRRFSEAAQRRLAQGFLVESSVSKRGVRESPTAAATTAAKGSDGKWWKTGDGSIVVVVVGDDARDDDDDDDDGDGGRSR